MVFSILLALYLDDNKSLYSILPNLGNETKAIEIIAALLGGGIIIIILGFVIGTLTINLLRLGFLIFGIKHYEESLSESTYNNIFKRLGINKGTEKQKFFAVVSFDHETIPNGVHQWILRRWNSFNVSTNSIMAFVLSVPIISYLNIKFHCYWFFFIPLISVLFLINAVIAWKETMGMIEFQSICEQWNNCEKDSDNKS